MLPTSKKSEGDVLKVSPSLASPPPPPGLAGRPTTAAASRPGERGAPSIIAQDVTITGNLTSKGEIQIDGEVQGDINGKYVIIGEQANVTGTIVAEEVVVRGHVAGSVRGRRVMLQSSSHLEGDVFHQSLAIEQGAFFEGKSRRSEDPIAGVPRPEAPPMTSSYESSSG